VEPTIPGKWNRNMVLYTKHPFIPMQNRCELLCLAGQDQLPYNHNAFDEGYHSFVFNQRRLEVVEANMLSGCPMAFCDSYHAVDQTCPTVVGVRSGKINVIECKIKLKRHDAIQMALFKSAAFTRIFCSRQVVETGTRTVEVMYLRQAIQNILDNAEEQEVDWIVTGWFRLVKNDNGRVVAKKYHITGAYANVITTDVSIKIDKTIGRKEFVLPDIFEPPTRMRQLMPELISLLAQPTPAGSMTLEQAGEFPELPVSDAPRENRVEMMWTISDTVNRIAEGQVENDFISSTEEPINQMSTQATQQSSTNEQSPRGDQLSTNGNAGEGVSAPVRNISVGAQDTDEARRREKLRDQLAKFAKEQKRHNELAKKIAAAGETRGDGGEEDVVPNSQPFFNRRKEIRLFNERQKRRQERIRVENEGRSDNVLRGDNSLGEDGNGRTATAEYPNVVIVTDENPNAATAGHGGGNDVVDGIAGAPSVAASGNAGMSNSNTRGLNVAWRSRSIRRGRRNGIRSRGRSDRSVDEIAVDTNYEGTQDISEFSQPLPGETVTRGRVVTRRPRRRRARGRVGVNVGESSSQPLPRQSRSSANSRATASRNSRSQSRGRRVGRPRGRPTNNTRRGFGSLVSQSQPLITGVYNCRKWG
jgi:hypothetical protein